MTIKYLIKYKILINFNPKIFEEASRSPAKLSTEERIEFEVEIC